LDEDLENFSWRDFFIFHENGLPDEKSVLSILNDSQQLKSIIRIMLTEWSNWIKTAWLHLNEGWNCYQTTAWHSLKANWLKSLFLDLLRWLGRGIFKSADQIERLYLNKCEDWVDSMKALSLKCLVLESIPHTRIWFGLPWYS
jgi:hypothetical protein